MLPPVALYAFCPNPDGSAASTGGTLGCSERAEVFPDEAQCAASTGYGHRVRDDWRWLVGGLFAIGVGVAV
jgi:hypothetical protein